MTDNKEKKEEKNLQSEGDSVSTDTKQALKKTYNAGKDLIEAWTPVVKKAAQQTTSFVKGKINEMKEKSAKAKAEKAAAKESDTKEEDKTKDNDKKDPAAKDAGKVEDKEVKSEDKKSDN